MWSLKLSSYGPELAQIEVQAGAMVKVMRSASLFGNHSPCQCKGGNAVNLHWVASVGYYVAEPIQPLRKNRCVQCRT